MVVEVCLADDEGGIVAFSRIINRDIRLDAGSLDGASGRRVVAGRRELGRLLGKRRKRDDRLHAALSEGTASHQRGPLMNLKSACHNFRGRG